MLFHREHFYNNLKFWSVNSKWTVKNATAIHQVTPMRMNPLLWAARFMLKNLDESGTLCFTFDIHYCRNPILWLISDYNLDFATLRGFTYNELLVLLSFLCMPFDFVFPCRYICIDLFSKVYSSVRALSSSSWLMAQVSHKYLLLL